MSLSYADMAPQDHERIQQENEGPTASYHLRRICEAWESRNPSEFFDAIQKADEFMREDRAEAKSDVA